MMDFKGHQFCYKKNCGYSVMQMFSSNDGLGEINFYNDDNLPLFRF
jgi:hypothetical protein